MPDMWRTGRKVGRTIYRNDELVGVMDTPQLAEQVVDAVNGDIHPKVRERRVERLAEVLFVRFDRAALTTPWVEADGQDQRHWLRQARELAAIYVGANDV